MCVNKIVLPSELPLDV